MILWTGGELDEKNLKLHRRIDGTPLDNWFVHRLRYLQKLTALFCRRLIQFRTSSCMILRHFHSMATFTAQINTDIYQLTHPRQWLTTPYEAQPHHPQLPPPNLDVWYPQHNYQDRAAPKVVQLLVCATRDQTSNMMWSERWTRGLALGGNVYLGHQHPSMWVLVHDVIYVDR